MHTVIKIKNIFDGFISRLDIKKKKQRTWVIPGIAYQYELQKAQKLKDKRKNRTDHLRPMWQFQKV